MNKVLKFACVFFFYSLWCQSLIYLKLYKMREHEVKEYQKILADYHQKVSRADFFSTINVTSVFK